MPGPLSYLTVWNMIIPVLGAPITEPKNPSAEPPWSAEPTGRGSWSILLNCLLTLGLCVWTTIHIDFVPNRTRGEEFWVKFKYVIIAMLAPEVMMVVAGAEWFDARKLRADWCEAQSNLGAETITPGSKGDTFGMAGAFLVGMGGVTICLPDRLPNLPTTVTSNGFRKLLLLEGRKMNDVDQKKAGVKTKTDALGKTIVCAQGMWMLVQCITRKATGLPVTLLELHVAMHVICALIIYLHWWDKPQDIAEPHALLDDPGDACFFALLTAEYLIEPAEMIESSESTYEGIVKCSKEAMPESPRRIYIRPFDGPDKETELSDIQEFVFCNILDETAPAQTSNYTCIYPEESLIINNVLKISYRGLGNSLPLGRLELDALFNAVKKYRGTAFPGSDFVAICDFYLKPGSVEFETSSSRMFESVWATALAVGIVITYGACHAAAWNTHFPSNLECWLWRGSSIVVAVIPSYFIVVATIEVKCEKWGEAVMRPWAAVFHHCGLADFGRTIDGIMYLLVIVVGILGRVFLVVESFISLRSLPDGSFKTTVWEDYWPHL